MIKRLLLIPFIVLAITVSVSAQEEESDGIMLGFHGGLSLSSHWSTAEASSAYERETNSESGMIGGAYILFPLGKSFAFQPELAFVQKGANHIINIAGFPFGAIDVTYCLEYIELPLIIKFYPFDLGTMKFYSTAGAYISLLTSSSYRFENEFLPGFTEDIDSLDDIDYGVVFGAGLMMDIEGLKVDLEYRYSMGFNDLVYPTGPGFPEIELRNYAHMFMIGIALPI
jgi:hypothetical protein